MASTIFAPELDSLPPARRHKVVATFDSERQTDEEAMWVLAQLTRDVGWHVHLEMVPEGRVVVDRARFERLLAVAEAAYEHVNAPYDVSVGSMSLALNAERILTELVDALQDGDRDPLPDHYDATTNTASASTTPLGSTPTLTSDRNSTLATSE